MKILTMQQRSEEWFQYKAGKIGGTRFGEVISTRKNMLKYRLLDELDKGYIDQSEYESEEMLFGNDQEPIARAEIIKTTGIQFDNGGIIVSDFFPEIHMHSTDGLFDNIVLEIKTTSNGALHRQRFFEGPESKHMGQIINPFVCSDHIKEVWWYSWCPSVEIRPLVKHVFTRESVIDTIKVEQEQTYTDKKGNIQTKIVKVEQPYTIQHAVIEGRLQIGELQNEVNKLYEQFIF